MIVADTNLIAYLLIRGERTVLAREVFKKDPQWAAPPLWRSEFRNVLALYLRQRLLPLADALTLMSEAENLLDDQEIPVVSAAVLRITEQSGCGAYDAEFIHVANELNVPLVTSDRRLLRVFPQAAVSPEDFVSSES